jgi:predicted MPP superfamily phosphohydrolase
MLRRISILSLCMAGLLVLLLAYGFLVEPYKLKLREVRVSCQGLRHGPVKIFLFSDVDFREENRRERTIRQAAERFQPDLVMVAGDLLDRPWATDDPQLIADAGEFLRSLPSPYGRILAPGEEESPVAEQLRAAWSEGVIDVISNEARTVGVRGETLDLFVAHPEAEPGPWWMGREGGRTFLESSGREVTSAITYRGEEEIDWSDVEMGFSVQPLEEESYIEVRFLWVETGPRGGTGWRLIKYAGRPYFRLYAQSDGRTVFWGRQRARFESRPGTWWRARVRVRSDGGSSRVRARFWKESAPEPEAWSIDMEHGVLADHHRGTFGFGGRVGRRRYAGLHLTDGAQLVLRESFDDPERLRSHWYFESSLAEWLGSEPERSTARLLLTHNPDLLIELAGLGGDSLSLVLAGHTHGGQVRLPGYGALFTSTYLGPRYDAGLFRYKGIPVYITPGVGTSLVPFRFLCPPEVTLLTLVPPGSGSHAPD